MTSLSCIKYITEHKIYISKTIVNYLLQPSTNSSYFYLTKKLTFSPYICNSVYPQLVLRKNNSIEVKHLETSTTCDDIT